MKEEYKRFDTKIETWAMPIRMRASSKREAEELARILFKIATHVKITAVEVSHSDLEELS